MSKRAVLCYKNLAHDKMQGAKEYKYVSQDQHQKTVTPYIYIIFLKGCKGLLN